MNSDYVSFSMPKHQAEVLVRSLASALGYILIVPSGANAPSLPITDELVAEAIQYGKGKGKAVGLQHTGRIDAIKHLRDSTKCSLHDAKQAIDKAWWK